MMGDWNMDPADLMSTGLFCDKAAGYRNLERMSDTDIICTDDKGRVIDSLYFGSFGKTAVMNGDDYTMAKKTYTYCPGPRAIFNLLENAENIRSVNQDVSGHKQSKGSF